MTRAKGRCGHDPADQVRHLTVHGLTYPRIHLTCGRCGSWLPLGPANDNPPEVQVEIRAAHLATEVIVGLPLDEWAPTEVLGWRLHDYAGHDPEVAPRSIGEERGWLARVILHDHESEES